MNVPTQETLLLTPPEARVLGSLVEKEITTPDYYPLSLNALINACNQRSNRDPVMDLSEESVRDALYALQERRLAGPTSSADSRVTKYEHRLQEVFNFRRGEIAALCLLLLRGPQTVGELRGRSERLHRFEDLTEVQSTLQRLMQREPAALVRALPRQPGTKEVRYAALWLGDVEVRPESPESRSSDSAESERITALEAGLATLHSEVADLRQRLERLITQLT